jgi:hypothetical protein
MNLWSPPPVSSVYTNVGEVVVMVVVVLNEMILTK